MNVREEDRQKNSCPSRGLGLAAAAIGVGVGAALYYFFSKRPENPDGEGSTTSGWTCEQPHAFSEHMHENEDSYTTISENSTSDTSIHDSDTDTSESSEESEYSSFSGESDAPTRFRFLSNLSEDEIDESNFTQELSENNESSLIDDSFETNYQQMPYGSSDVINVGSESDAMDWDVTTSSVDVPVFEFPQRPRFNIFEAARDFMNKEEETLRQQALYEEEQIRILREEAYRERTWSLEECSICFDIILKDQQVTTLPCTHHFHSACITPWLQEQQTCPNCRKAAE